MQFEVNSSEWWNYYFTECWEANFGKEQTEFFMGLIQQALPSNIKNYLNRSNVTILDWGCALGQGVEVLKKNFPKAHVIGLDSSKIAIQKACSIYPDYNFTNQSLENNNRKYTAIFCSNCLEHFDDPIAILASHIKFTESFYILLVPYNEVDRAESHKYTFKEDSFPEIIDDFFKAYSKVIECKDSRYWSGSQLIVIYARKSKELVSDLLEFKEEFKETNYFDSTSVELWDNVSNTYIEEASPSELSLAQEIEQLLIDLGIDKESSLLEVGCGSGHLSGYLAAKGYKTTLMDFSNKALEKAKKYYDHKYIQGEFVQGDLMELSIEAIRQHDVVWNSGVLEHFNSIQALNALKRMRGVAKKYVIILIPNAKSIPYLSWRKYAMENGSWVWGKEYLRESMELLISAAGLEIVEERYIGRNFVKDQLEFVNSDVCKIYLSAYMHNVLPENQDYLVALVARPVEGLDSIIHNKTKELLKEEAEASDRTYNFDNSALLRRTTFLQKKGEEFIASYESVQKMLVNTTDALRAEVESRSIKEKELDNTITALQSDIEARIQNEYDLSAQIRYDRERIAKIENSVTWKLLTRYQQVIDICLPYGTVRRRGYDKCLSIVRGIFIKLV